MNKIEQEFNSLFIKEQKLKKIQKEHALAEITYISNYFKKRQKKATLLEKIERIIDEFIEANELSKLKKKHNKKLSILNEQDKKDVYLKEKRFTKDGIIFHIILLKHFQKKSLVGNSKIIDISDIEFNVYLQVELNNDCSDKYYEKKFQFENEALSYFDTLERKIQKKDKNTLMEDLKNEIDNEIIILNTRIVELKTISNQH